MATLAFSVEADYEKVIRLRDEIARLETELDKVSRNGTPEEFSRLEGQLASCRKEMKEAVRTASELGASIEASAKSANFTSVQEQVDALTYAISQSEAEMARTAVELANLKKQGQEAFEAGDTAGLEAVSQQIGVQVNQYRELQEVTERYKDALQGLMSGGVDTSLEGVAAVMLQIGEACQREESEIERLRKEYQSLNSQLVMNTQQGTEEHRDILDRMQAIEGEIAVRKQLVSQLREQDAELEAAAQKMRDESAAAETAEERHASLRTQIRLLKEQMADMRANGIDEQSAAYRQLAEELGRLQDIQGDIQRQGSILADDERQFAGVTSGLQGMTGGFLAVQGAMSLFGTENQKLQSVLMKTHAIMTTVNALQQVSAMLNKDSAFRLVTLANAREWWNKLLDVGRGKEVADTVATQANTASKQANTAAQTGNTAAVGANTAAQTAETGAAVAGTAANITLAGAFRMVGAAIKSIPVFGWIAAGISAIIAVTAIFVKRANEAKKAAQEFYKALADEVYKPVASVRQLSYEWERLGDNMEAKQKFIEQNSDKFKSLGAVINDVSDAENLLVKNTDAFIEAQMARARATVYLQQAMEAQRTVIEKEEERDKKENESVHYTSRTRITWKGAKTEYGDFGSNDKEIAKLDKEIDKENKKIEDLYKKAMDANNEVTQIMQDAGIAMEAQAVEGSTNAIRKQMQKLQEQMDNEVLGSDKYNELKKQYEALEAALSKYSTKGMQTRVKTAQKEADDRLKTEKDLADKLLALQAQNEQDRIDLIEDSTERQLAKIESSYNQQIAKVRELAKEMAKANAEAGTRGATESASVGGETVPGLTAEQRQAVTQAAEQSAEARKRAEQSVYDAEKDAMYKFLKEYGTYEEQRLAITEQYAKKIADAGNVYERMSLTSERDSQLRELDVKFRDTTDWADVFGSIDTHTDEYLRKLQDKIRDMMSDPSLTADEAEALGGRLVEIQTLLVERSGKWAEYFGIANEQQKQSEEIALRLAELEERKAQAIERQIEKQAELDALQQQIEDSAAEMGIEISITDIENIDDLLAQLTAVSAPDEREEREETAEAQVKDTGGASGGGANAEQTKALKDMVTQFGVLKAESNTLTNDIKKLDKSIDSTADEQKQTAKGFEAFKGNMDAATKAFSQVGGQLSEGLSGISDMMGGEEDGGLGETFGQLADGVNAGIDAFASFSSGDYVGAALSALQMFDSFGQALGIFGDSDKTLHDDVDRMTLANEELANAINGLSDKISGSTTSLAEAYEEFERSMDDIAKMEANTQEMMSRSAAAYATGIFSGEGSSNKKINNAMTAADWERVSEAAGVSVRSASDFWNLTSEQMYNVSIHATDMYAKIKQYADDGHEDAAQYMDDYISYLQEEIDMINTFNEKLTSMSFDSLTDSFKSAIMDMDHTAQDFADDFEEMMKNAIVGAMMSNKYADMLQEWYDDFAKLMEDSYGNFTPQMVADLQDEYNDIVGQAQKEVKALYEVMGWDTTSSSQTASSGSFQTMSEDTGQELNGRFTAMYESMVRWEGIGAEQADTLALMSESLDGLLLAGTGVRNVAEDALAILNNSYLELMEISTNTGDAARYLRGMSADMSAVKQYTSRL